MIMASAVSITEIALDELNNLVGEIEPKSITDYPATRVKTPNGDIYVTAPTSN